MKKYFRIVPTCDKETILKEGFKCNEDGIIFLYTKESQGLFIAANQLRLYEYTVFMINSKGISGQLYPDMVGDYGSEYQFMLEQKEINPKYIIHFKDEKFHPYDLEEIVLKARINAKDYPSDFFITNIRINPDWLLYYNKKYNTNYSELTLTENDTL